MGATLIVVGSIHGNEASGAVALRKVTQSLQILCEKIRGRVYFIAGNTRALAEGVRFIDADLNRHWTAGNIVKNKSDFPLSRVEDFEQRELLAIFDEILKTARDEVYVLDLHSTSAEGLPFATVGDTLRNRRFVQKFPVTILLGIEEQLEGTMLEYLNNAGCVTFGFEGGQHYMAGTALNHERSFGSHSSMRGFWLPKTCRIWNSTGKLWRVQPKISGSSKSVIAMRSNLMTNLKCFTALKIFRR